MLARGFVLVALVRMAAFFDPLSDLPSDFQSDLVLLEAVFPRRSFVQDEVFNS